MADEIKIWAIDRSSMVTAVESRNQTETERIPAPGGKDFLQAYNCQAVVDSAHQVIVAARATNQTSDKQQAVAMMEGPSTTSAQSPGKYPPMLATTRQRQSMSFMLWAWTRSSRRSRPATAGLCHPRPEVAYPGLMRRKLQTRRGRQRYALRQTPAGDSGGALNGDLLHGPQPGVDEDGRLPRLFSSCNRHKRDPRSRRDAVSQVIDYCSYLESLDECLRTHSSGIRTC